jgi:hypothetical protein
MSCSRCGKENVPDVHTCTPVFYRSSCCNSVVYCVGGRFKIDMNDKHGMDNIPRGRTFHAECGNCGEACDVK